MEENNNKQEQAAPDLSQRVEGKHIYNPYSHRILFHCV